MASRFCLGSIGSANISSSDFARRWRGASRSTVTSFIPSGIQTLVTQGVPRALPMAAPILRQQMPCSTQNLRIPSSACASVKPSAAFGCEKYVGLKSMPTPWLLAQSIQRAKCLGSMAFRSTFFSPGSR